MRITFLTLLATLCTAIAVALTPRDAFDRIASQPGMPEVIAAESAGDKSPYDLRDIRIMVMPELDAASVDSLRPALTAVTDSIDPDFQLTEVDSPEAYVNFSARPDTAGRYDMLVFVVSRPDGDDRGAVVAINGKIDSAGFSSIANARVDTTGSGLRITDADNPGFSIVSLGD